MQQKCIPRTNYIDNVLLQNNRKNLAAQQQPRGQIYSKKSLDDLLNLKNLSVSPPTKFCSANTTSTQNLNTRRVPVPMARISLKYLRPSLASSTNSLSSLNHSIASSTSSLSDHHSSKSCLKIQEPCSYS